jgi:DNA-binding NtrC family response regulator
MSRGKDIKPDLLLPERGGDSRGVLEGLMDTGITIDEMERRLIMNTLEKEGGNKTKTAKILGISVRTLRNKLNRYKKEKRIAKKK